MLVIIEENYRITVWCREIVDGLRQEARKKRTSLAFSSNIEDIDGGDGENAVIIVGAETEWLDTAARKVISCGKHPIILSNQPESLSSGGASRISEDIYGSMSEILDVFSSKGIANAALYAVNPDSASDKYKKEAFLKLSGKGKNIFENEGSLQQCFDRFIEIHRQKPYRGVVCANDFAAISLVRHLKELGEELEGIDIISYSDTLISRCTSPTISTVRANFKSFGQLAFVIVDCLTKGLAINGMHIYCRWEIIHRETSAPSSLPLRRNENATIASGRFYNDPELIEMMRIETLLSECDDTDLEIVKAILSGKKSSEIGEACYLTDAAVKYRIKKMKDICLVESRSELKSFLKKYICDKNAINALNSR